MGGVRGVRDTKKTWPTESTDRDSWGLAEMREPIGRGLVPCVYVMAECLDVLVRF